MEVDDGNFDDIIDLQDLNLGDFAVLPNFHEFPESQLCVPPDPIEHLEWFPSFSDDFISLKEISCPTHHQPPDDQNLLEYCSFPATPEQREHHEKEDWVGIMESGWGGFTKKKARTTKKKSSGKYLENNQKPKGIIKWERNLKRCSHCETEETPQWRVGPMGPKTLCNACGVRFKSGRLLPEYRPAASPTFDVSRHSNYHKKILKRRGLLS